ncbi:MAG: PglZ domain-containing protein [Ignavibacteria bacterium]|nr:PglZ domain-containing protein [Ignavibacteria bacterium]
MLPQSKLTFDEKSDIVYADGISTQGTPNRLKILQKSYAGSIAISAEDFMKMKSHTEGREFVKPYNVIYIYSNHIDKIGDDRTSEGKVFEATEDEFEYLLKIIKQVNNVNGYNMIITSDHGYLYQHNKLEETDFTDFAPEGNIYKSSRRFVLGKDLNSNSSVKKWKGMEVDFLMIQRFLFQIQ